jgi:acyl-CoA thioesterase
MFEAETAVRSLGGGRHRAQFSSDWWVHAGPNGGIVAATVLRACSNEVGAGDRVPRSLTVHYLAPPQVGEADVDVTVERAGRGVTFVSARLSQGERALAVALAAYASPRPGIEDFGHEPMPELPPPEDCPHLGDGPAVSIRDRWECRVALGRMPTLAGRDEPRPPASQGRLDRAFSGGWLRLAQPTRLDHHVIAAMADAWVPPVYTMAEPPAVAVPTLELTIHFRDAERLATLPDDAWFACTFRSELAQEGFMGEDGLIWAADGRLVAASRQLAVLSPRPAEEVAP